MSKQELKETTRSFGYLSHFCGITSFCCCACVQQLMQETVIFSDLSCSKLSLVLNVLLFFPSLSLVEVIHLQHLALAQECPPFCSARTGLMVTTCILCDWLWQSGASPWSSCEAWQRLYNKAKLFHVYLLPKGLKKSSSCFENTTKPWPVSSGVSASLTSWYAPVHS